MSNHYHLLLSVPDAHRLARFMGYVNSKLAREIGRLTGWRDKVWSRRYQAIVVSDEVDAQIGRLHYVLCHGVKEGLVDHPADWPGANTVSALLGDRSLQGLWFDRTQEWAARHERKPLHRLQFAVRETLQLEPLPCWARESEEFFRETVAGIVRTILAERSTRSKRGRVPRRVVAAHLEREPHYRPKDLKRSATPWFHCASRAARRELLEAYGWFRDAYMQAAAKLRAGDQGVTFPEGSFPPAIPFVGGTLSFAPP